MQAGELHIEVFLPAQVPDSELDAWMESRIYPVMSDIPAPSDLITSMVASGYATTGATMMRACGVLPIRLMSLPMKCEDDMPVPNPAIPVKGAGTTVGL